MQKSISIFIFILLLQNYNIAARPIGQREQNNSRSSLQSRTDIRNYFAIQEQDNRQIRAHQEEQEVSRHAIQENRQEEDNRQYTPTRNQTRIDSYFTRRGS